MKNCYEKWFQWYSVKSLRFFRLTNIDKIANGLKGETKLKFVVMIYGFKIIEENLAIFSIDKY
jgi:hypothetical protein